MGQEDTAFGSRDDTPNAVPVLPLRDVVVYTHMVIPLFVGREKSIKALDAAMSDNKQILLIAQKSADVDEPQTGDIYGIGTLASILQLLKLPDGTVKVLVEGGERASIKRISETGDFFTAEIEAAEDVVELPEREMEVLHLSSSCRTSTIKCIVYPNTGARLYW